MANTKEKFEEVANEYLELFIKKQEIECDGWIADGVGGIASFVEQYYFNLDDIRRDIEMDAPKGLIIDWQLDNIQAGHDNYINYYSYIKGLRHKDIGKKSPSCPLCGTEYYQKEQTP